MMLINIARDDSVTFPKILLEYAELYAWFVLNEIWYIAVSQWLFDEPAIK